MNRPQGGDSPTISPASPARKIVSLLSVIAVTGLLEAYLWWGKLQYAHRSWMLMTALGGLGIVTLNHWFQSDDLRRTGLRIDNLPAALRTYGPVTLVLCGMIALTGALFGSFVPVTWIGAVSYLGWALLQQHLLQNFYHLRLSQLLTGFSRNRNLSGALLAALVFAFLHWPNLPLVLLSLLGGGLWCWLFIRTPNLWGAAASQFLVTLTLILFFKFSGLRQFEVGAPGMRFDYFGEGVRVAAGTTLKGNVRIGTLPGPDRGHPALVRLFDASGSLVREWNAFPEYDFSGEIAIGPVGETRETLVAVATGPGYSNPPLIRLYRLSGELLASIDLDDFPARQGAWISIACGRVYAAPGPGPRAPQKLIELTAEGKISRRWQFPDLPLRNGLRGTAICSEREAKKLPDTLILWGTDLATNPSALFVFQTLTKEISLVDTLKTTFGAQVAVLEVQNRPMLAVSPGPLRGHPAVVQLQTLSGEVLRHLTFSEDPENYGNNLAAVDLEGDGTDELVLGEGVGPDRGFQVQIRSITGQLLESWSAYSEEDLQ